MKRSPEQYLSNLEFSLQDVNPATLTDGERAFVEKYLGSDLLERLPQYEPLRREEPQSRPTRVMEPEIQVAAPAVIVAPVEPELKQETSAPEKSVLTDLEEERHIQLEPALDKPIVIAESPKQEIVSEAPAAPPKTTRVVAESVAVIASIEPQQATLKERLRQQEEIQMVSFFVGGQLFLLPVEGIQEVLRYEELVKVPNAPDFIAGVINLRGRVTPLVHLEALLTNNSSFSYGPQSFIIICGSEQLQIGLIIEKVNSMHMLPNNKIIWNAEAKLGEGATEFLSAIANLDDRVCGIVEPDAITRKILGKTGA